MCAARSRTTYIGQGLCRSHVCCLPRHAHARAKHALVDDGGGDVEDGGAAFHRGVEGAGGLFVLCCVLCHVVLWGGTTGQACVSVSLLLWDGAPV